MVPIFDGWFCFGGTEIINNARTVGYARTASQIPNLEGPEGGGSQETIVARNLLTDPSFETASGTTEVRRNLIRYTDLSTTSGWTPTAGVVASDANRLRYTSNGGSISRLGGTTALLVAKPAGSYVASLRAQAMDATIVGVRVLLYDSVSATIRAQQSIAIASLGNPSKYEFSLTANGAFNVVYMEFYGTAIANGAIGFISEPLLESGTVHRPFFNGDVRPKLRRNLALNPRARTGGGAVAWQSNNVGTNPLTMGVTPPVSHPLGFTTAAEQRSTGTTPSLGSIYNLDGLGNTGTPQRIAGLWVMVNEPGYRVPAGSGWDQSDELPVNEWTFVKMTTPRAPGNYTLFFVTKIAGNASTTARAYMTAAVVEERTTPVGDYFDGGITARAGFANTWEGAAFISPSYMYDTDTTASWSSTVDASEALLTGARVATYLTSTIVARAFQSTRWVGSGMFSLRQVPSYIARGSAYTDIATSAAPGGLIRGETYTIFATFYQEAPQGFVVANQRSILLVSDDGNVSAQAADIAGEQTLRLQVTIPMTGAWYLRLYNGGMDGDPSTWWDSVAAVLSPYGGGYFSGDTQDADGFRYQWWGVANASESVMILSSSEPQGSNYCDINWFTPEGDECRDRLFQALREEVAYEAQFLIDEAPWYSESSGYSYPMSPSRKFLGAFALSVSALSDSTRTVGITEGILSGGVLGRERLAVPRFRFQVLLTAVDEEGLEYGKAWLSKALSEQSCSTHGPSCGSSDLTFIVSCPPLPDPDAPDAVYDERWDSLTRMYHDVKCIEGPITTDQYKRGENSWGAVVEFTLAAGVPNMFGAPAPWIPIDQAGETIIQDIPFNYIPYPSAEIAGADVTAATNYSLNPSVETNATGWLAGVAGGIAAPMVTSGRVTGELSSVGTASFRAVFTATGAGTNGTIYAYQEVEISTRPAGSGVSINMWAAEALMSGAPVRGDIVFDVVWAATPGGAALRTDPLGTAPVTGGSASKKSIIPPPTATIARVRAAAPITSWPSGTVVRLYADALAVTVP